MYIEPVVVYSSQSHGTGSYTGPPTQPSWVQPGNFMLGCKCGMHVCMLHKAKEAKCVFTIAQLYPRAHKAIAKHKITSR